MLGRSTRTILWAVAAGSLSVLAAGVSLRLTSGALGLPWGRGTWIAGDAALMYMTASTMVRFGWVSQNPDVAFPQGMDLAHIPFAEIHQWSVLRAVTAFTDDPVLALNVFFLIGFFAVGFTSFLLFDATIRNRSLAIVLGVALATLPWHYSRFHHTLLADYSPVPVFLLLAFLMWTGWWSDSRKRLALGLVGALYVGTAGVYYAFFACLILGPVLLRRIFVGRRLRQWWRDALVVASIPAVLAASLIAHRSLAATELSVSALGERVPIMSIGFAGIGQSLFTAWPFSDGTREGSAQFSVLVAVALAVSWIALIAFTIGSIRGRTGREFTRLHSELRPWFLLLVWTLVWFLPGAGWLFALTVTPEIRSWGRLSMVLAYLAVVILGILLRELGHRGRGAGVAVAAGLIVLLGWQVALDHRPLTIPRQSRELEVAGATYAAEVGRVLDAGCPVLQLPALEFPEDWRAEWRDGGMGAYDHMWVQLYAPDFRWSFGAPRGTEGAALAQRKYAQGSMAGRVENARADGFCAVHVDARGLDEQELAEIRDLLGDPAAEVGRWALFPLASRTAPGPEG